MSETLPPNFLAKKGGRWRNVSLFDLAILLYQMHQAAKDENIGFEDTNETLMSIHRKLNKSIWVEPRILENMLWSSNLMNEQSKFWHPHNLKFEDWVKKLLGRDSFDHFYNVIVKAGEK